MVVFIMGHIVIVNVLDPYRILLSNTFCTPSVLSVVLFADFKLVFVEVLVVVDIDPFSDLIRTTLLVDDANLIIDLPNSLVCKDTLIHFSVVKAQVQLAAVYQALIRRPHLIR